MVQEPSVYNTDAKRTVTHPNYNTFKPVVVWAEKPRTLTGHDDSPITGSVLNRVYVIQPGRRNFVAGDFNRTMPILNDTEVLTRGKSTLDFVFTDITGATTEARPDLYCGSDHVPLAATIPGSPTRRTGTRDTRKADLGKLAETYKKWTPKRKEMPLTKKMCSLQQHIKNALVQCINIKKPGTTRVPWWNDKLKNAAARFREVKKNTESVYTEEDIERKRKRLRGLVRRSKDVYWQKQIDEARTFKDVFKIAAWRNHTLRVQPPLLEGMEELEPGESVTQIAKTLLFRERIEVPEGETDTSRKRATWMWEKLSTKELEDFLLKVKSTTPGTNSTAFSSGKRAREGRWFGLLQGRGIPERSAVGPARHLVDRVESSKIAKEYLAVVLMDVKGAFNAANPNTLINALRELEVDEKVV
ncbi:hypothetical protein AOQ84DRAFT_404749 [Glonium stellatum]|uniref:Reverse transcriptase domain-containing protein n=1 Tax=Glonium stellatum TaxID=574774 RepID=A0A8E2F305_9PEZI|nr:hypothetical protein AOQ84DRAFT_404749 [Glonium stellatum]